MMIGLTLNSSILPFGLRAAEARQGPQCNFIPPVDPLEEEVGRPFCLDSWVMLNRSIWHEVFDDGSDFQPFASSWMLVNPVSGAGEYPGFTSDGHQFTLDVLFYVPVDFNATEVAGSFTPTDQALLLQHGAWGGLVIGRIVTASRATGAAFHGILCGAQDSVGTMWNNIIISDRVANATADQLEEYRDCFSAEAQAGSRQLCAVPQCPFDCRCGGTGNLPPEGTWEALCAASQVLDSVYYQCVNDVIGNLLTLLALDCALLIGAVMICAIGGGVVPVLGQSFCMAGAIKGIAAVTTTGLALLYAQLAACNSNYNQNKKKICGQACHGLPISP